MSAYVVYEALVAGAPAGNQLTVTFPEPIEPGDRLVMVIGGGNQVPSAPSGWSSLDFRTGQEAQGRIVTRTVPTAEPGGLSVVIGFDGNDRCGVALIHVRGENGVAVGFAQRLGAVGASYGAYGVGAAVENDVTTYLFAFQRNSGGVYATVDDVDQVGGQSNGAEGISLYRTAPSADTTAAWNTTAGRSGHYLAAVQVYGITRTEWLRDAEPSWIDTSIDPEWGYQIAVTPEGGAEGSTNAAAAAIYQGGIHEFPASSPASPNRIELQYQAGAGGWGAVWHSAYRNLHRTTSAWTASGGVAPPDVVDPDTGEIIAPGAVGIEWNEDPGPALRQRIRARMTTLSSIAGGASTIPESARDWLFYAVGGEAPAGAFVAASTIVSSGVYVGSIGWNELHPGGDPAHTPATVYGIIPGNPNAPVDLYVTGLHENAPGGAPPGISGANDGLAMVFDAGLEQEYQTEYRLLHRVQVTVGPPIVKPYLRRHPADGTASAWGSQGRHIPRSRRRRNFGQQP